MRTWQWRHKVVPVSKYAVMVESFESIHMEEIRWVNKVHGRWQLELPDVGELDQST